MKNLSIEVYCANFENYDLFEQIMAPLKDKGIGIELSIFDDDAYNARLLAQKARFSQYHTTFHGPHVGVEAASPAGSPAQKKMVDAFEESFRICNEFRASGIVIHTNQRSFRPEEKARLQEESIATLNIILDMARQYGVDLWVENVGWSNRDSLLFDEDEFIDLFDRLRPWANCLIDTGHAMINRWDFEKVIRALSHKIKAYHIHNNDGQRDTHRPMFESGQFYSEAQTRALAQIMEKYTPDAEWILEYAPGSHISPELIARECDKLLTILH
jgi:sugar phosphate isomerase/epimerase